MNVTHTDLRGPFEPRITVFGLGGAGGNAVNNMIEANLTGVNFVIGNTDAQAMKSAKTPNLVQLGIEATGGLGAGARPEIGRTAAEESLNDIEAQLDGSHMVFITAGMGGGTGTGAAPVVARLAREKGILTVGVVTKPFQFEGAQRMRIAEAGIEELAQYVDTLIVIPNQNLFRIANEKTTFAQAFRLADDVLQSGVRGVTDLMVVPGMINLDFADIRSATSEMGKAMMGTGQASGERRAIEAAEQAINNPLLDDVSMKGARSVIINVAGGHDLTLFEIEEACNRIIEEADPDATIIFGSTHDDALEGSMRITVIATGIEDELNRRASRPVRPTHMTVKPVEIKHEEKPVTDAFVTRYPDPAYAPAPVETARPAASAVQPAVAVQPQTQPVQEVQPQVAVAHASPAPASGYAAVAPGGFHGEAQVQSPTPQQQGYAEMTYVADGATMRKVQDNPMDGAGQGVIPPYAPQRTEAPAPQSYTAPQSSYTGATQGGQATAPAQPAAGWNPARQQETRKTPSLFERITGSRKNVSEEGDETRSSSTMSGSPAYGSGQRKTVVSSYDAPSAASPSVQGQLDIEVPKVQNRQPGSVSDDLDIPAFLRRQIS